MSITKKDWKQREKSKYDRNELLIEEPFNDAFSISTTLKSNSEESTHLVLEFDKARKSILEKEYEKVVT